MCPATFTSGLAAARPTPQSSARRSRYAASLSRTTSPAAMVSASPDTRRRVASDYGPACRRSIRAVAAANRARISDSRVRSTSGPYTSPRNVAKSRASTHTSAGANARKCSSAAAVSSRDHVR